MKRTASISIALVLACTACSGPEGQDTTASRPVTVATTGVATPSSTVVATTSTSVVSTSQSTTTSTIPIEEVELRLVEVASGFTQPVFVTAPPGDRRLFIVDQPGTIWVVDGADPEPFLDITDRVEAGGERGLLGLAFPDDHAGTGKFYVDYTDRSGDTRISEFELGDDGRGDPSSERTLLTVDQPAGNHNGGMLDFGPDGLLWIGMGDGGGANDQFDNGQDPTTLLGGLLRIEPVAGDRRYRIPDDNPFADGGGAPELWAIGLRNPWRWSFDGTDLWIGDVGQNSVEEVDVYDVRGGGGANFGWPVVEGNDCFRSRGCDSSGFVQPVATYTHDDGCSVTGGYVYRGAAIPSLDGHYFFGDYCAGWVASLERTAAGTFATREWFPPGELEGLTSFGVDSSGEIYVTVVSGSVYRIASASAVTTNVGAGVGVHEGAAFVPAPS